MTYETTLVCLGNQRLINLRKLGSKLKQGVADIKLIKEILEKCTANAIASGTGLSLSTVKKLKSGERSVEKLNLGDAIRATEFAMKNRTAKIEIWK